MMIAQGVTSDLRAARLVAGLTAALLAGAAGAETPDVGETIATAGIAYEQTTIAGTMATIDDIDLYRICISDGAAFGVTLGNLGAGSNDGQLFLFDASGVGKAAVDDPGTGGLTPAFPAGNAVTSALPPGEYLLGISSFDRDPVSGGLEIFPSVTGVTAPSAGRGALDGWNGAGNANALTSYTMTLTGVGCAAPVLASPPADITVAATCGAGATVAFTPPTATDFLDQPASVTCTAPSGSTFPSGETTVTCSATDGLGQTTAVTFRVTVTNAPPSVVVPADVTVSPTGAAGAPFAYAAVATDIEDGTLTPVCTPASGSTFAVGSTTVSCTATDGGGLSDTRTFTVTVGPWHESAGCGTPGTAPLALLGLALGGLLSRRRRRGAP
jgi:uncharacterized protein (TIGR03382 family)